jgi:hypothetical protein
VEQAHTFRINFGRAIVRCCWRNRVPAKIAAIWCLLCVPGLAGQQTRPSEYEVEATYLYNFSRFVEWPATSPPAEPAAFAICVLGQNPFGRALANTVANENINGKNVVAKQVQTSEDAAVCRVLFISASEEGRLKQVLAGLSNASVLTVSDLPRFTERGGMIQFVLEDNRVRFQVNVTTAKRAGLVMSSELLKLATTVRRNSTIGN